MLALLAGAPTYYAPTLRPGAAAGVRAPFLTPHRARPAMMCRASAETAGAVAPVEPVDMDSPRVRTVCVALLGQLAKIEEEMQEMDFDGFSQLVDDQEVQCSLQDKKAIFAMIDADGGGTVRRPPHP